MPVEAGLGGWVWCPHKCISSRKLILSALSYKICPTQPLQHPPFNPHSLKFHHALAEKLQKEEKQRVDFIM